MHLYFQTLFPPFSKCCCLPSNLLPILPFLPFIVSNLPSFLTLFLPALCPPLLVVVSSLVFCFFKLCSILYPIKYYVETENFGTLNVEKSGSFTLKNVLNP